MSASAIVDRKALDDGIATHVPGSTRPPTQARRVPERRSRAPLCRLTRDLDLLCTQAVDPLEIAAGLEAAGINDRQARTRFHAGSVFELAEQMFELVPRRPITVNSAVGHRRRGPTRDLLRGLLYGLPALLFVAALREIKPGPAATLLLISTVTACALGQGLSFLGHRLLGHGVRRASRRLFRGALVIALAALALLTLAGLVQPAVPMRVGILAGTQIVYVVTATVLLVVESDLLLLALLGPAAGLAAVELYDPASLPDPVVLAGLLLCLLGAATAAWARPSVPPTGDRRGLRTILKRHDLTIATCYAGYGAATSLLLLFTVIDILTGATPAAAAALSMTMLPLIASLGIAECLHRRFQRRTDRALRQSTSIAQYAHRARAELGVVAAGYAATLAGLTGGLLAWLNLTGRADSELTVAATSYATLGLALFLDTLLLSRGRYRVAAGLTGAALLLDSGLRWALNTTHHSGLIPATHHGAFSLLAVGLLIIALFDCGRLERYQ
jgi:acyl-coenzyme A thioesterase PaaI-like protein